MKRKYFLDKLIDKNGTIFKFLSAVGLMSFIIVSDSLTHINREVIFPQFTSIFENTMRTIEEVEFDEETSNYIIDLLKCQLLPY